MKKHCKGCRFHHNANNPNKPKFNDWCCKYGGYAPSAIGWCKLNNIKETKRLTFPF